MTATALPFAKFYGEDKNRTTCNKVLPVSTRFVPAPTISDTQSPQACVRGDIPELEPRGAIGVYRNVRLAAVDDLADQRAGSCAH